jgi:hypothetical protein
MSSEPVFVAAAAKTLSAVEVDPRTSHQHELAAGTLRRMLIDHDLMRHDADRCGIPVRILRLSDDEDAQRVDDVITVYDARRAQSHRGPEWRAYYGSGSEAERLVQSMHEGDQMVYAIDRAGITHVLLISATSHWSEVLRETFGYEPNPRLVTVPAYELQAAQRRAPIELIADALEINPVDASDHDWLVEHFDGELPVAFPDSRTMAALAHARVGLDAASEDADTLLERWLAAETDLFMVLERVEGEHRITGCETFEDHIATVLSILQRRKARRGRSLEIHLEALFTARSLPFERQVETEPGSTSDFILPGIAAYRALGTATDVDAGVLHLGAKSTARERWKQVLSEAAKLQRRHLATLDPQLSHASLHAMSELEVIPVMPARLGSLYEGHSILTVEGFIAQAKWLIGRTGNYPSV